MEGWHGKINHVAHKPHPVVVEQLKGEQATTEINQQQLASEGAATSTRRKYRLKEKRIVTVIEKFDSGDYSLNEYINSLSGWVLKKHYC